MDDPIFDPWSIGERDLDPTLSQRTPRWRSAAAAQAIPRSRPAAVPPMVRPAAASALSPPSLDDTDILIPTPSLERPTSGPALSDCAVFLHALLIPPLTTLIQRLEMAGHETTVDDCMHQPMPSLRFRIRPRQGPFDEEHSGSAAVLEILVGEGRTPEVNIRLWLDPLSATPSEQSEVAAANLTETWVDRLFLDFVEKTLRQG